MKLKYEFTVREIAGDFILVPAGESALAYSGMITTNEVGALLMEKLRKESSKEDLVTALLEEFSVSRAEASSDVEEFLENAEKLGLLEGMLPEKS